MEHAMIGVAAGSASIPALGFGTWELQGETAARMVRQALDIGYRHIDTAQMYGNEREVGQSLHDSGVARGDVFLTTKIWPDRFAGGDLQRAAAESLRRLGTDYVDLLLLHWPNPAIPLAETVRALNEVRRTGLAREIGLSNYPTRLVAEARKLSEAPLVVNQVEYHPFLAQNAVLRQARELGMAIVAYCPIARGRVFGDGDLTRIGAARGKTASQVALRWLVQQGVCAIPRTCRTDHAAANFDIFDFELSGQEMRAIHALARPQGRICDYPGLSPEWDGPAAV